MRALALLAATLLAACAPHEPPALYPLASCVRLKVADAASGAPVFGAEDLDIDREGRRIFISAYDRRAAERAAARGRNAIPQGGVYVASLDALLAGAPIAIDPLVDAVAVDGGLRPHGVAYDAASGEFDIINRAYSRDSARWRMAPRLLVIGRDGATREAGPLHCAANDVARLAGETAHSFDHARCGWRGSIENVTGARVSGVRDAKGDAIFSRARFANGLLALDETTLALAATRENALYLLRPDAAAEKISLSSAPDNLTRGENGAVIVAVHPSLFRLALQRTLGVGRAGSKALRVDPVTGAQTLLFSDRKGEAFSAATVAVEAEGALILGSPMEPGLLLCRAPR